MPLVLAIEPDPRQAATLKRVVKGQVRAELVVVDSKDAALSAIAARVPDLILVTALLPPRDEDDLTRRLKTLDHAGHLQTLTIPVFASAPADEKGGRGFGGFRRKKRAPSIDGCDPKVFGNEIETYLQRAVELREEQAAIDAALAARQADEPPVLEEPPAAPAERPADMQQSAGWDAPFAAETAAAQPVAEDVLAGQDVPETEPRETELVPTDADLATPVAEADFDAPRYQPSAELDRPPEAAAAIAATADEEIGEATAAPLEERSDANALPVDALGDSEATIPLSEPPALEDYGPASTEPASLVPANEPVEEPEATAAASDTSLEEGAPSVILEPSIFRPAPAEHDEEPATTFAIGDTPEAAAPSIFVEPSIFKPAAREPDEEPEIGVAVSEPAVLEDTRPPIFDAPSELRSVAAEPSGEPEATAESEPLAVDQDFRATVAEPPIVERAPEPRDEWLAPPPSIDVEDDHVDREPVPFTLDIEVPASGAASSSHYAEEIFAAAPPVETDPEPAGGEQSASPPLGESEEQPTTVEAAASEPAEPPSASDFAFLLSDAVPASHPLEPAVREGSAVGAADDEDRLAQFEQGRVSDGSSGRADALVETHEPAASVAPFVLSGEREPAESESERRDDEKIEVAAQETLGDVLPEAAVEEHPTPIAEEPPAIEVKEFAPVEHAEAEVPTLEQTSAATEPPVEEERPAALAQSEAREAPAETAQAPHVPEAATSEQHAPSAAEQDDADRSAARARGSSAVHAAFVRALGFVAHVATGLKARAASTASASPPPGAADRTADTSVDAESCRGGPPGQPMGYPHSPGKGVTESRATTPGGVEHAEALANVVAATNEGAERATCSAASVSEAAPEPSFATSDSTLAAATPSTATDDSAPVEAYVAAAAQELGDAEQPPSAPLTSAPPDTSERADIAVAAEQPAAGAIGPAAESELTTKPPKRGRKDAEKKRRRRRRPQPTRAVPEALAGVDGRLLASAIAALRVDIARLRQEALSGGTPHAAGEAPRAKAEAAAGNGKANGNGNGNGNGHGHASAQPPPEKQEPETVEDEWGFFNPERCGMQALLARLDASEKPAEAPAKSPMQQLLADTAKSAQPAESKAPPARTSDPKRLAPLAMWARAGDPLDRSLEELIAADRPSRAPVNADLRLLEQVAAVRYGSGCRIRRVRVAPRDEKTRPGEKRQVVIVSKKALDDLR